MSLQNFPESDMYRKLANDCIDRAQISRDNDAAAGLIRLAQFWLAKAGDIDHRNASTERLIPSANSNLAAQLAVALQ